jgi:hypothetical protein
MNKLLATLLAAVFAASSTVALAQTATDTAKDKLKAAQSTDKAKKFDAQEKQYQDLSKSGTDPAQAKANVDKSKMDPRTKAKFDEQQAQSLSRSSQDPAQAKANVAASKAESPKRSRMPDIKSLTKEERAQLLRELQKASTP